MGVKLLRGDCRNVLKTLPSKSVHCVVTSPPYWGLRDYGTAKWEGGDPSCDHKKPLRTQNLDKLGERLGCGGGHSVSDNVLEPYLAQCGKCGARRIDGQIGLEPTFDAFIAEMAAVFREVRRVLRKDGTCWVNMGDSYAANVNGRSAADIKALGNDDRTFRDKPFSTIGNGIKSKDLCGIPWRVALALQADGWWLRQDIIWAKPNPMPESVTDRCTKAHEYIFLLSKSARYYYDAEAIKEEAMADNRELFRGADKYTGGNSFGNAAEKSATGLVADRLQRNAILIELNPTYAAMAERRIFSDAPLFADVAQE